MNKKKLVFITCLVLLSLSTLYIFDSKRSDSPPKAVLQKSDLNQKDEHYSGNDKTNTSFKPSFPESDKRESFTEENIQEQLENLKKFCEEEFPQFKDIFPSLERLKSVLLDEDLKQMWLNLHLKDKDKRIWRLRRFLDDGQNGEVERVILYKEDETGFPRIVESSENQKKDSPSKLFQQHLKKGEAVHTDEAYTNLYKGSDYFFELTNGQITRIEITSSENHIDCQFPY